MKSKQIIFYYILALYKLQNRLSSYEFCEKFSVSHKDFINIQVGNYEAVDDSVIVGLIEALS